METKKNSNFILPLILFVLLGSLFVGTTLETIDPVTKVIHQDCLEYTKDEDGDGLNGIIEDQDCQDYPYSDGTGETQSWSMPPTTGLDPPYQIYWDLSVDFTRFFISQECSNNLAGCAGTNFQTETQFYCWFENNVMSNDWYSIFNRAFSQIITILDDGSLQMHSNHCSVFTMPNTLTDMGTQNSSPISDNPSGTQNGGMGNK